MLISFSALILIIFAGTIVAYFIGYMRSQHIAKPLGGVRNLATLPSYYAMSMSLWALIPALILLVLWIALDGAIIDSLVKSELPAESKQLGESEQGLLMSQVANVANGVGNIEDLGQEYQAAVNRLKSLRSISDTAMPILAIIVFVIGALLGFRAIQVNNNARYSVEKVFNVVLLACSCIAVFTTFGIVFSVLFESLAFFQKVPFFDFLLGTHWSPQIAIRDDQAGASGSFGVIPLIVGTLLISFIALLIAVPVGLMSAIYLSEYASARVRGIAKPALEILAGVPTVVYGFFAALTVAPAIRRYGDAARAWGAENDVSWLATLNVSSESALAAGIVMGIMIIPLSHRSLMTL